MSNERRVVLARSGSSIVATEDGRTTMLTQAELPAFVADREVDHPRWIWDDTTRWHPDLLAAGVRVQRCVDLRLTHNILRRSPFVDQQLMTGSDTERWDKLQPDAEAGHTLFATHELGDALDVAAEAALQAAAVAASAEAPKLELLIAAESAGALIAAEMAFTGLPWSVDVHLQLLEDQLGPRPSSGKRPVKLEALLVPIRDALGVRDLNPDSPAELLRALQAAGLDVKNTRSWTLKQIDHPVIAPLLEYKKLVRLMTANGWYWLDTWVGNGRFRPHFLPGGVVTGRWAAQGGGALQFPAQLRTAVVADDGWKFVVADVAQLEPRVLAGRSRDNAMAAAASAQDLYEGLVKVGAVKTRNDAKLGMLGAMYGGVRGESGRMVERMKQFFPDAIGFVESAARTGERGEVVNTLLGRGSPLPDAPWVSAEPNDKDAERERRAWGRFTRNFVIQGTGAEWALCWMADLRNRLWNMADGGIKERPHLVFFLHDEVVVHTPAHLAEQVADAVRESAASAGRRLFGTFPVDFPLDVAVVDRWSDGH